MKKIICFYIFSFLVAYVANAQKHAFGITHDYIYGSGVTQFGVLDGGSSHYHRSGNRSAVAYSFYADQQLQFNTGVQFQRNFLQGQNASSTAELIVWNYEVEMINVPFLVEYTFWNILSIEGGPLVNFQTNYLGGDAHSGIGGAFAVGLKYSIKRFIFCIKNRYQIQTVIPFSFEGNADRITTSSCSFGLFYKF